jgi:hypothetical protein
VIDFLGTTTPYGQVLGSLLPCLCRCDDGNEGVDRLGLRQHKARGDSSIDAYKLDGIAGGL